MLLCADAAAASADLAGGLLACPSCRTGQLKPLGHGRERVIRLLNGASARLRPQRARAPSRQLIPRCDWVTVAAGDVFVIETPGGGGYGAPVR